MLSSNSQSDLVRIVEPYTGEQLNLVRELFREYASSLPIDLCFQGFDQELAALPGRYAPPDGRLFLALGDPQPAGCVAMRKLSEGVCEMKRLYVRPECRGQHLGWILARAALAAARLVGYRQMRLDTLASMKDAIRLYETLGFARIPPYYDNPSPCAVFMGLDL